MKNRYRLRSTVFEREEEKDKIKPKKIFFLSVEGNVTEKEYFNGVSAHRVHLGINAIVNVEVLNRSSKDTGSAPSQVIELLEEYVMLRESGKESLLKDIPVEFVERYGIEFIQDFLDDKKTISKKEKNAFVTDLLKIGYDIKYRQYLHDYRRDLDEFGILIDRDMQTHSEANMLDCIQYCKKKHYTCYIANPCFEFWLLLHLSDVKSEYGNKMDKISMNEKVSSSHTFVSREVSKKAHHAKNGINFQKNYMPFIDLAIKRAKEFASDDMELVENVGCNIWKLLEKMKNYDE